MHIFLKKTYGYINTFLYFETYIYLLLPTSSSLILLGKLHLQQKKTTNLYIYRITKAEHYLYFIFKQKFCYDIKKIHIVDFFKIYNTDIFKGSFYHSDIIAPYNVRFFSQQSDQLTH